MWLLFITTSGGGWPFCCSLVYNSCIWQCLFWSQVKLKRLQHEGYFLRLNTGQEHCLLTLSHLCRGRQWVVELFRKLLQLIEFSHCWIKNWIRRQCQCHCHWQCICPLSLGFCLITFWKRLLICQMPTESATDNFNFFTHLEAASIIFFFLSSNCQLGL